MVGRLANFFSYQCPKFPWEIVHLYENALLFLSVLHFILQAALVFMSYIGIISYGPFYRIFEGFSIMMCAIGSWIFHKKNRKNSNIFASILAIGMTIGYFECVILYNEAEEGLLFYAIFSATSLMMLDFLRYYWIMVLYHALFISYIYARVMVTKQHSSILDTYDVLYYCAFSMLIICSLSYIFTTAFNIIHKENSKSFSILQSWKNMMNITPIGIIIISNKTVLFSNEYSKSLLTLNGNEDVDIAKLIEIFEFDISQEYEIAKIYNKVLSIGSHKSIHCIIKDILFEEKEAHIIIMNDISKIIEAQNQKAEQEMIELLVSTSTHEMRTPIHCVKNILQMMLGDDTKYHEFISRAIIACDMQEGYVNDMLDYAKLKKESLILSQEYIIVSELLSDVCGFFKFTAEEHNLFLKLNIPDHSLIIYADYSRLRQIMFNIISNAFKFTIKGGITLKAFVETNKVYIQVVDSGVGINHGDIDKLFKPFSMVASTKTQNKSGTGLGLFVSKSLTEKMGGQLLVESEYGIGSTFSIILNQITDCEHALKKRISFKEKCICHSKALSNKKALIVDDNGFNCKILEKMLSNLNISSYMAFSGQSALEIITSQSDICVGFFDLQMPFMDGYELIRKTQGIYMGKILFPIFALTGDSSEYTKQMCEEVGFRGHLIKPFTAELLINLLNENQIL